MDLDAIVESMKGYFKEETIKDFISLTKRFGGEELSQEDDPWER